MKTENTLNRLTSKLHQGTPKSFLNLTVIPLFYSEKPKTKYRTLSKALKKGLIEIVEKNTGGSVPELRVINKGDKRVLLIDSEELAGAKQNRILNTSILLKKNSETIIPVSCTESGRWDYNSPEFTDSGNIAAYEIRRKKSESVSNSLNQTREYRSNQGEVWDEIENYMRSSKTASKTRAMKDIFDNKKKKIKDYIKSLPLEKDQNGFIILVNNKVAGLEFISSKKAFAQPYEKLLKSYDVDALIKLETEEKTGNEPDTENFWKDLNDAKTDRFKSVGHGYDNRIKGKLLTGNMLTYKGEVIHLAVFSNKGINSKPQRPGFYPF